MRAVIDTNVFVSFLLSPRGAGAWLIAMWRDSRFEVVVSPALHEELVEVLEFCGRPGPEDLKRGVEFGARFAEAVKQK